MLSPTPLVTDVPLAVVRDIIPALLQGKATIESIELICAVHKLNPLLTEPIVEIVRENLSLVREDQRCVFSRLLLPKAQDGCKPF